MRTIWNLLLWAIFGFIVWASFSSATHQTEKRWDLPSASAQPTKYDSLSPFNLGWL